MRFTKALHLSVISIAFVAALSLTTDALASDGVTSLPVRTVDDMIIQCGVFIYLVFAVCLLVYALRRRYRRRG
jgi:hypothetical protein